MTEAETDETAIIEPGDLQVSGPEEWETAWWDVRDEIAEIRVTNQHGRGQPYPVLGQTLAVHDQGKARRWSIEGMTAPLSGPEMIGFAVGLAVARGELYRTASGKPPRDVTVRMVLADASGASLVNVSKRLPLVSDEDDRPKELRDLESQPQVFGYVDAQYVLDMMQKIMSTCLNKIGTGPGGAAPSLEGVRELLESQVRAARVEGQMQMLLQLLDTDDDDDDDEGQPSKRRELAKAMPAVAAEFAKGLRGMGEHGIDTLAAKMFGG